jgi:hypothetical protein
MIDRRPMELPGGVRLRDFPRDRVAIGRQSSTKPRPAEALARSVPAALITGPRRRVCTTSGCLPLPPASRRTRRRPALQAQVPEDLLDHRLLQDRRDDLRLAAAARAVFEVDLEHALEQSVINARSSLAHLTLVSRHRDTVSTRHALTCKRYAPVTKPTSSPGNVVLG